MLRGATQPPPPELPPPSEFPPPPASFAAAPAAEVAGGVVGGVLRCLRDCCSLSLQLVELLGVSGHFLGDLVDHLLGLVALLLKLAELGLLLVLLLGQLARDLFELGLQTLLVLHLGGLAVHDGRKVVDALRELRPVGGAEHHAEHGGQGVVLVVIFHGLTKRLSPGEHGVLCGNRLFGQVVDLGLHLGNLGFQLGAFRRDAGKFALSLGQGVLGRLDGLLGVADA